MLIKQVPATSTVNIRETVFISNCTADTFKKSSTEENSVTKECFSSLDKCDHFFGNECYSECPDGTIDLYSQLEEVKD